MLKIDQRAYPVLKWAGGKSELLPQLEKLFPQKCNRFLEPFLGGGAVFLALDPEIPALISDANEELVNMLCLLQISICLIFQGKRKAN